MKKAFEVKQKAIFIHFKGLSVARNCFSPESAPLKNFQKKTYPSQCPLLFYAL